MRQQRQIDRRVKSADFRELKPLDDFDFAFNPSIKRAQIFDLATCRFIREAKDVLLVGPPGTGKSFLAQAIGYQAIKQGHVVLYRSIFDVVRDFLHDEALEGQDRILNKYLKPDLLIVDDMGMKNLPKRSGEVLVRDHHAAVRNALHDDDQQPPAGRLGQADRRRAQCHGDSRSLPASRGSHRDQRPQLSAAESNGRGAANPPSRKLQNQPFRPPARRRR